MRFCFLLLVFLGFGCASDGKSGIDRHAIADKTAVFKVSLSADVLQDDTFSLYYTTDGSTNFATISPIWREVKGHPERQEIVFALPPKVKPSQLRLDLGNNPKQSQITLRRIILSYAGKAVELPGTLIFSYFQPDITKTQFDATTGVVNGKTIGGKKRSPSLYPKEGPLADELEKLYNP